MTITINAITPDFVAEIYDADLTRLIPDADFTAIANAFWKYSVLIFPEQDLTQQQQLAFAERFGPAALIDRGGARFKALGLSPVRILHSEAQWVTDTAVVIAQKMGLGERAAKAARK